MSTPSLFHVPRTGRAKHGGRPRPVKTLPDAQAAATSAAPSWTFLTNHSHVLVCLSRNPTMRLRDVADLVGVTERAVQRIISDLEAAGVLSRQRVGRCNHYALRENIALRHPLESHRTVGDLLNAVAGQS